MRTIFSKIIQKEISNYTIAENEDFLAFLDIYPVTKGHTLVIPKKLEEANLFNLPDEVFANLFLFAKQIAKGIQSALPCKKVGLTVIGLEVPHAHVHLIPLQKERDMDFTKKKLVLSPKEFLEIQNQIQSFIHF